METRLSVARKILNDFLNRWPLEKVRSMSLDEYVGVGNRDTFCQWLETKTKDLGGIKGEFSKKFGVYQRVNPVERPHALKSDDKYSWMPRYGNSSGEAFEAVKGEVIATIEAAKSGKFEKLSSIRLDRLVKWKIAFLYSDERIVPIFKREILDKIAAAQGLQFTSNKPDTLQLQSFIYSQKPPHKSVYEYASDLYKEFGPDASSDIAYYIVGSKYGENDDMDYLPQMVEQGVVAVDFASGHNLAYLYRESQAAITDKLIEVGEEKRSYQALRQFLQLKPGDLVAVKSSGNPRGSEPFLEIAAYVVVVEKDGVVYWYDPKSLGQCINVEYIKTGLHRQFRAGGYGRTVHTIEDDQHIKMFFGPYVKGVRSSSVRRAIKGHRRWRKASDTKDTGTQERSGSKPTVANLRHNKIQQQFRQHLQHQFATAQVQMEENNVDLKVFQADYITFYEVKPYWSAEDCIRSGLGQLLSYACFDYDPRPKRIRIVGPNKPDKEEKNFIDFLKNQLSIDFDYECFSMK